MHEVSETSERTMEKGDSRSMPLKAEEATCKEESDMTTRRRQIIIQIRNRCEPSSIK
jgi:hypothetical protein